MTSNIITKKLIYGKGINDCSENATYYINGKKRIKLFYMNWHNMLRRCYSNNAHKLHPTYIGCTVCNEWLNLASFKRWHDDNYIEGHHLDKDIIQRGNKVYAPEFCRYVSRQLNSLLLDCGGNRGKYPQGVSFIKSAKTNKYKAQIKDKGEKQHIGCYPTSELAFKAYANAKHEIIIEAAREQTDIALREGLVDHAKALLNEASLYA